MSLEIIIRRERKEESITIYICRFCLSSSVRIMWSMYLYGAVRYEKGGVNNCKYVYKIYANFSSNLNFYFQFWLENTTNQNIKKQRNSGFKLKFLRNYETFFLKNFQSCCILGVFPVLVVVAAVVIKTRNTYLGENLPQHRHSV